MARTAVVAGTATAVSNRVSRRQANRWAQQGGGGYGYEQEPEPEAEPVYASPPPAPPVDPVEQLQKLAGLHDQGVLTDEEFAVQKRKILDTV
jgi:hypothetical protein